MSNEKEKMLREIEICVSNIFSKHDVDSDIMYQCIDCIISIVSDYEISKRTTEVVVVETPNVKIAKRYAACLRLDGKSDKTIKQYIRTCKEFSNLINKNFVDVDSYDIRLYLAHLKRKGSSNRYLENQRSYIAAFYRWMVKDGLIVRSPADNIQPIKFVEKVKHSFSDVELDALRSACKNVYQRAILEMLLSTGARASELVSLNKDDINLQNRTAFIINGKGGKNRIVYFSQVAAKYYAEYLSTRHDTREAAFVSKYGRLTVSGLRALLKTLGKESGVDNVHPHRFRRTLASNLADRGMAISEIMKILGHSNINTTMIYVAIDDKRVENSYKRFA